MITEYRCKSLDGEIIEEDGIKYCKIKISKRKVNPERIAKFRNAVAKCKGLKRSEYLVCMKEELKR